jgi:hypothetical protein
MMQDSNPDFAKRLTGKRDDITKILNQRTQPTLQDVGNATTQRFLSLINPKKYTSPGAVEDVAATRVNREVAPHMAELEMLQKAADAGHADSKAVLDTFSKFAPDPDQYTQLMQAAASAPEDITPANAATFAARFAQENGFGESSRRIRDASVAEAEAKPRAVEALIGARSRANTPGSGGGGYAPMANLPLVSEDGELLPPEQSPGSGDPAMFRQIDTRNLGKAPSGFMWAQGSDGQPRLAAVPGGPADESRRKGQAPLTGPEQTKLNEQGTRLSNLSRLNTTFSPDYVGYIPGTGNVLGLADSWGYGGPKGTERANWWQDYQTFVNEVRHSQFGAALTATEKAEFEKAMVTRSTDPKLAKRNLERQQELVNDAITRNARSLAKGGKNAEQIAIQTGLPREVIEGGGAGWSDADEQRLRELEAKAGGR